MSELIFIYFFVSIMLFLIGFITNRMWRIGYSTGEIFLMSFFIPYGVIKAIKEG